MERSNGSEGPPGTNASACVEVTVVRVRGEKVEVECVIRGLVWEAGWLKCRCRLCGDLQMELWPPADNHRCLRRLTTGTDGAAGS